jgi:hypothetical protein
MDTMAARFNAPSSSPSANTDWQFLFFWVAYAVVVGSGFVVLWSAVVALVR